MSGLQGFPSCTQKTSIASVIISPQELDSMAVLRKLYANFRIRARLFLDFLLVTCLLGMFCPAHFIVNLFAFSEHIRYNIFLEKKTKEGYYNG